MLECSERGTFITRADPWVLAHSDLLDELRTSRPFCVVNGLELKLRDSAGATTRYLARPDVSCPSGTVVLQQMMPLLPAMSAAPEHQRG